MGRQFLLGTLVAVLLGACTSSPDAGHRESVQSSAPTGLQPNAEGYALGCPGEGGECPTGHVPSSLRRPLHLPTLAAGAACPVSPAHRVAPGLGPAHGLGPVYAVLTGPGGSLGVLDFVYPPSKGSAFQGSPWGAGKVLWIARSAYKGPVLIRGAQLDGSFGLGFSVDGPAAYVDLQLPPDGRTEAHGWRTTTSETRLRRSGCYAYQVDGTDFSEVIVFQALAVSAAPI